MDFLSFIMGVVSTLILTLIGWAMGSVGAQKKAEQELAQQHFTYIQNSKTEK